ncbi:MAG TPA: siderophore-interacting protein [Plantibacter sp.]|uniref:siderophore-interacting protein n=1 Tax=unclassified Plantibacter TaxID=2624265 RepID=UPI002CA7B627|nr:siderophore-interacting protein [Plantibacter sp.]
MPVPFLRSPNVLFDTVVGRTERLSPGFLRITLVADSLAFFAPYERDQRIKILIPPGASAPVALHGGMPEHEWRRAWRDLPVSSRPVMRSYTAHRVRPDECALDLDVFVHQPAGPASRWALSAVPGDPLLVSGPDVRRGDPMHGIQWEGSSATSVLLAADETAFPAVLGILNSLDVGVEATVLLEVGDPADTVLLGPVLSGHACEIVVRSERTGAPALVDAVERWLAVHGSAAADRAEGFAAWLVTESSRIPALREATARYGIDPDRVHAQGYWNARPRPVQEPRL